jgi:hypothetical protein
MVVRARNYFSKRGGCVGGDVGKFYEDEKFRGMAAFILKGALIE